MSKALRIESQYCYYYSRYSARHFTTEMVFNIYQLPRSQEIFRLNKLIDIIIYVICIQVDLFREY